MQALDQEASGTSPFGDVPSMPNGREAPGRGGGAGHVSLRPLVNIAICHFHSFIPSVFILRGEETWREFA